MPPALAIAERDGLSGRDLLVALAAGCEVTTRVGLGLDYPEFRKRGWHGPGVIGPFGAAAAVGRLLEARCRHDGESVRARGQPGRRHVRGVGHADGQVPSMPRRAVGADGGAARAAGFPRHARISHREGRRPLQHVQQRRKTGGRDRRTRRALGARADRAAPVAFRIDHPGSHHGDVRSRRRAPRRSRRACARSASRSRRPRTTCTAISSATRASSTRCFQRTMRPR